MTVRLTTDVVLADDDHTLTLSGPRTGVLALHFDSAEDTRALYQLFADARARCVQAHEAALDDGGPPAIRPGDATHAILCEIITLTEVALEAADGVSTDDGRVVPATRRDRGGPRAARRRNNPNGRRRRS